MKKNADLHVHTHFSDGTDTPQEVMARAREKGLSCIAIADHDTVDGIGEAVKLQDEYSVEVIPAVEITAQEGEKELHILAYFIDWQSQTLKARLKQICDGRIERIFKIAEKLRERGINANAEDIIKFATGKAVSRLHVAKYLVEKGLVPSMKTAFDKYIGDGKPCYVSRFKFSLKEIADIIKRAGGIAVIAHPGLDSVSSILPSLVKNGIEGIEVYHSDHTPNITDKLKQFAQDNNLLVTGGSDCHGLNKRELLMGKIKLPYSYVEKMKDYVKKRIV
ncbi:MAG: PHP domain-containing protein [Candidatus Omnitrophota bacterium]